MGRISNIWSAFKSSRVSFWGALLLIAGCSPSEQEVKIPSSLTIGFYNVENLFDIVNDPNADDDEFLPEGAKHWDKDRYEQKISDLSKVLKGMGGRDYPAFIGLSEIENRMVVEDLIHSKRLKGGDYGIAHFDSPDQRGIDVAFLFRKKYFTLISCEPITVEDKEKSFTSREILHVKGKIKDQVFHFFVNHWPSRRSGETRRVVAANALRRHIDTIYKEEVFPNIVVMGDFNDEDHNKSLKILTESGRNKTSLTNIMSHLKGKDGTCVHKGKYYLFDNILVSEGLSGHGLWKAEKNSGVIYKPKWLVFTTKKGLEKPNRTYVGNRYVGGVSDHFPVYFALKKVKKKGVNLDGV